MTSLRRIFWTLASVGLALLLAFGCGSDEVEEEETDDRCPGEECVDCDDHGDCETGTYCDDIDEVCVAVRCDDDSDCDEHTRCEQEFGRCIPDVCEPDTTECDGDAVVECNADGTEIISRQVCEAGTCVDGECGCADDGDCDGEQSCVDGDCLCPDGEPCGEFCCAGDHICSVTEVCDAEEDCRSVHECRPECAGSFCGFDGELCCEGDTPACGPDGRCAPSCDDAGELCGDDFDECCPDGDVCVFGECRTPGHSCDDFSDCDFHEYCDAGLQRCMPDQFPDDLVCEQDIDFDPFDVENLWHWTGLEIDEQTTISDVANTPVVADMNGDQTPEVAFTVYPSGSINDGVLVVVDGDDATTLYVNDHHPLRAREHHAIADIDGDGFPEIAVSTENGIGVVDDIENCDPEQDEDGCYLWTTDIAGTHLNQAPSLADVTGNGRPEVIYLHSVFDGLSGEILASAPSGQASMPVAIDLTGDGRREILTSGCAFHYEEGESELQPMWCNDALPGANTLDTNDRNYVGVGDVVGGDRAGRPEVIWVGLGDVFLLDEETGDTLHEFDLPGAIRGGPPVVADFDGDGSAEFGVGGQTCYTVFDLDCLGSDDEDQPGCERPTFPECTPGVDCVVEPCSEVPGGTGDGILWSIEIIDSVTGTGFASAVFDFQGDGRHEVVYGDHCRVFVLDGRTGTPLMTRFASRRANSEMPIVVDVDGDGRSNLLYQANADTFERDCEDPIAERPDFFPECFETDAPDYCDEGNQGLFALRDVHDAWVGTRAVWNQHAYHMTNIDDDLSIPDDEAALWEEANTFRANRQGEVPLNAPDVVVSSLQVNALHCPPDIALQVTVENQGISGIPAEMPVSLYRFDAGAEATLVETIEVGAPISPGQMRTIDFSFEVPPELYNQDMTLQVVANDDGEGGMPVGDCNPDDASTSVDGVVCSIAL